MSRSFAYADSATAYTPCLHFQSAGQSGSVANVDFGPLFRVNPRRKDAQETNTAADAADDETLRTEKDRLAKLISASRSVRSRIVELTSDAEIANDPHSEASAVDLSLFLHSLPITERPSIFLLDNGNYQAVWRNGQTKEQISLQFFGGGEILYAIFAIGRSGMDRVADTGTFGSVQALITRLGCRHLIK